MSEIDYWKIYISFEFYIQESLIDLRFLVCLCYPKCNKTLSSDIRIWTNSLITCNFKHLSHLISIWIEAAQNVSIHNNWYFYYIKLVCCEDEVAYFFLDLADRLSSFASIQQGKQKQAKARQGGSDERDITAQQRHPFAPTPSMTTPTFSHAPSEMLGSSKACRGVPSVGISSPQCTSCHPNINVMRQCL